MLEIGSIVKVESSEVVGSCASTVSVSVRKRVARNVNEVNFMVGRFDLEQGDGILVGNIFTLIWGL